MTVVCPTGASTARLDCRNDDYFHGTTRPADSYLGTPWNAADSGWLEHSVETLAMPAATSLSVRRPDGLATRATRRHAPVAARAPSGRL
jgi:hypothetical protein